MGFSRQEYWSGVPLPSPGDLPKPGIEPSSPAFQLDALTSEPPGKPYISLYLVKNHRINIRSEPPNANYYCWVIMMCWSKFSVYNKCTTLISQTMVFPVVMYGYDLWTKKKAECWRIDAFQLWCWRILLRVPWTARRSNQAILRGISPEYSWKDWCWSWNSNTLATWCEEVPHLKRPWCWERLRAGGKGMTEDQMVEWHHWLNGHEFEQTLRDNGQGSLACCSPWGHKESDMTKWLNNYKIPICNMSSSFFTSSLAPWVTYFVPPLVEVWRHSSRS